MNKNMIIVIQALAIVILVVILFWPAPQSLDAKERQRLEDSLVVDNERLHAAIGEREDENRELKFENDSLSKLPAKINTIYSTIYEKTQHLPANDLAREFERVFAEAHIE
jgi:hypothetical protein